MTPDEMESGWVIVRGQPVYFRGSRPAADARVILHLHGFAISGKYMLPTAAALSDEFGTYVPDLPGFGRSIDPDHALSIPELADSAAAFLDEMGVETATILGNSLGCAILASFAARHPDRIDRAVMVSPAGGVNSRPLPRAIWQLVRDAPREPLSMASVAAPDYLRFGVVDAFRLFRSMTQFPALERLIEMEIPTLAVLGSRDPLLPRWSRITEVSERMHVRASVVIIKDAAHAINFSHPRELAAIVRQFMDDRPIVGLPDDAGAAQVARVR